MTSLTSSLSDFKVRIAMCSIPKVETRRPLNSENTTTGKKSIPAYVGAYLAGKISDAEADLADNLAHRAATAHAATFVEQTKSTTVPILFADPKVIKEGHFSIHKLEIGKDENAVATCTLYGVNVAIKVNPTDARGYRMITCLVAKDMRSVVQRFATLKEHKALREVESVLLHIFETHQMVGQLAVAGNKAHKMDSKTGQVTIGETEPYSSGHAHIWARGGLSTTCYIADVPIRASADGTEFNLMGPKVAWSAGEMKKVAQWMRKELSSFYWDHPEE